MNIIAEQYLDIYVEEKKNEYTFNIYENSEILVIDCRQGLSAQE